jgi:serine/threonine protein kinase
MKIRFFSAPEVLAKRGEGSYTNKVDVWSLGVILYICLGNKNFLLFD